MGQSISGLAYMRKVIIIDGTQVKSKFKGCMMTASAQDGNFQVFPIGFGVVDGENDASWTWFFQNLIDIIPDSDDLLFISDRHSSIYSSLRKVYQEAKHGACAVHLGRNVLTHFKSEALCQCVHNAAHAYTVGGFKYWFAEIEKRSAKCAEYLTNIGLSHWTRAYSECMRFNVMSSNVAESLNGATTKAMDYPIVSMVEWIRTMLMRWFYLRRKKAAKTKTILTPEVELLLETHLAKSAGTVVKPTSEWIYQVDDAYGRTFTVDLKKSECSCKVFDTLLLPCSHALAAASVIDLPREELANDCYTIETWAKAYEQVILPPRNEKDEDIPADNMESDIEAPEARRPPGRRRKKRMKSFIEKLVSFI